MEIPAADRLARFISIVFRLPAAVGVIFNAIEIEIVISPSLLGLFLLYFHRISPAPASFLASRLLPLETSCYLILAT
jgi:hypothetical protein